MEISLHRTPFAEDVESGLNSSPKVLHSMYFYDKVGDDLFRQIMAMPEYYLTRCEHEILTTHKQTIFESLKDEKFELIEFGAGDAYKTRILLHYFNDKDANFQYVPIDISANILNTLSLSLQSELPALRIKTVAGEYFQSLAQLSLADTTRKLVLFLGSNIGNMDAMHAEDFLRRIYANLNKGDLLLLGADLKKDPRTILAAYNDKGGITAQFNLNLLHRLNTELEANFDLDQFYHYPLYEPETGTAKSFIISKCDQEVIIKSLDQKISFKAGEQIATEISQKYDITDFQNWADATGFHLRRIFTDKKNMFANILFVK